MDKRSKEVHLGMFGTTDLLSELARRKNIEFVVGVRFVDGTSNIDRDTIFCVGRWVRNADGAALLRALREYIKEAEPEDEDDGPEKTGGSFRSRKPKK